MNRSVATAMLAEGDSACEVAENVQDAPEARPFDPELMGCQVPVVDGFEATRRIHEVDLKNVAHLPIIGMATNAVEGDRERCPEACMGDELSKPFDAENRISIINHRIVTTPPSEGMSH